MTLARLETMTSTSQPQQAEKAAPRRKVSISLDDRQLGALRWIAQSKGIPMSQVIQQAIELEGYLLDRRQQGARIIVEDNFGRKVELRP